MSRLTTGDQWQIGHAAATVTNVMYKVNGTWKDMNVGIGTCEIMGNTDGKKSRYSVTHTNGKNSFRVTPPMDK